MRGVRSASTTCFASYGTKGRIEVPDFWFAGGNRDRRRRQDRHRSADGTRETVSSASSGHLYSFEADAAADAILAGKQEFASPGMSWADTLGNPRARQVAR